MAVKINSKATHLTYPAAFLFACITTCVYLFLMFALSEPISVYSVPLPIIIMYLSFAAKYKYHLLRQVILTNTYLNPEFGLIILW